MIGCFEQDLETGRMVSMFGVKDSQSSGFSIGLFRQPYGYDLLDLLTAPESDG